MPANYSNFGYTELTLGSPAEHVRACHGALVYSVHSIDLCELPTIYSKWFAMVLHRTPMILLGRVQPPSGKRWFKVLYGDQVGYTQTNLRLFTERDL